MIDLFSGTGAATQAFKDRGHRVVRLDLVGKPDVRADVRALPLRCKPDFVWASPPCTQFSQIAARNSQWLKNGLWPEEGFATYAAACDAIAALDPTYWVIENVRGAAKWWGAPTKRCGPRHANKPWLLWGNFPPFDAKVGFKWQTAGASNRYDFWRGTEKGARASRAAAVPYALSLALCLAIERDLL